MTKTFDIVDRESIENIVDFTTEENYFEQRRRLESKGYKVVKLDSKWSGGSSPIILIKFKYWKP